MEKCYFIFCRSKNENKALTELALRGLDLLSEWTSAVTEVYSWKLLNPTDHLQNNACPPEAVEYERATRYNYSEDEKNALIEIIVMIKSLQAQMASLETIFTEAICRHIHQELQEFVQLTLREPLKKSIKNKKNLIRNIILSMRDQCADWIQGIEGHDDRALKGKKEDLKIPQRNAGPGSTQLYMVRTMLESLIEDKTKDKKVFLFTTKTIDDSVMKEFEEFHRKSFYWNHLLNFSKTMQDCCDLSQLWYREFYLEMTMGKHIQFPIEMSMPWILTEHILETKNPLFMDCLLYPLDLYNDSAHYALNVFKKKFLYDEIEAEVNLCFDQFVYKLSEQIYAHYKNLAGNIMIDKKFKEECQKLGTSIEHPANRYIPILCQKHVQLLGRSIDLNRLICQRINTNMKKSLEFAFSKFEGGDITGIVELEALIRVNKITHNLLSKHFIIMCSFDFFQEKIIE